MGLGSTTISAFRYHHGPITTILMMEDILYAVLISVEVLAATIINHYDPAHRLQPEAMIVIPGAASCASSSLPDLATAKDRIYHTLLRTILDPSPIAFIFALSLFALAALCSHQLNRHHRLRDRFLIVGICLAVIISGTNVFIYPGSSLAEELQTVLPWTLLLASMASSLVHWSVGGMTRIEESGDESDGAEVEVDKRVRKVGSLMWEEGDLEEKSGILAVRQHIILLPGLRTA